MTPAALLAYTAALAMAIATPGPSMMAVIARSVARGPSAGFGMAVGIAIGDVILGALTLLGLMTLIASYAWTLSILKYAGATYLLWVGSRMWRSQAALRESTAPTGTSDLRGGLLAGLSNPKAMLFHASLMPLIIDLKLLDRVSAAVIVAIIFAANLSVMSIYASIAGAAARRLCFTGGLKSINRLSGGAMIGAAAAIALR